MGAPLDAVVVGDGLLQPLLEVVISALPAKDMRKILSATLGNLGEEAGLGRVHSGGVGGHDWDRCDHWLV